MTDGGRKGDILLDMILVRIEFMGHCGMEYLSKELFPSFCVNRVDEFAEASTSLIRSRFQKLDGADSSRRRFAGHHGDLRRGSGLPAHHSHFDEL